MLALDHIVVASKDPLHAASTFEKNHQGVILKGGKHENWGTYNYLAYFQNSSYIEWLGIDNEDIAKRSNNPLIHQLVHAFDKGMEGAIQIAFRTNKMDDYVKYFNESSILYKGPTSGSRKKPDGKTLKWRMLFPQSTDTNPLPFLIEWGEISNFPDNDQQLIHSKDIHQIQLPTPKDILQTIYQLHFVENYTRLANTILVSDERGNIEYYIK